MLPAVPSRNRCGTCRADQKLVLVAVAYTEVALSDDIDDVQADLTGVSMNLVDVR